MLANISGNAYPQLSSLLLLFDCREEITDIIITLRFYYFCVLRPLSPTTSIVVRACINFFSDFLDGNLFEVFGVSKDALGKGHNNGSAANSASGTTGWVALY